MLLLATLLNQRGDTTTAAAAIAGMDISVTNKAGDTTWSLGTTVSGVGLTLASSQKVTATFGLAGNTMVVTSVPERAAADCSYWYSWWYPWYACCKLKGFIRNCCDLS